MGSAHDPGAGVAVLARRRSSLHARGVARRLQLIESARVLLAERELDTLSLGDVARHARVPVSSAYHFYNDIRDLYAALLAVIENELLAAYRKPVRRKSKGWQHVIEALVRKGARIFAADPAARQLMVGPKTPQDLKLRDRGNDVALGRLYEDCIDRQFVLPRIANRSKVFFRAVEIIDLMFSLSMAEHGRITREYVTEATRAAVGYLGNYLPQSLPRR